MSTTFKTFITMSGDSTTLSGANTGHHGWGEPFSGKAQVDSSFQPVYSAPWDLTSIQKGNSSITTAAINYGDAGSIVSRYLQSTKYKNLLTSAPKYALLLFGQDEIDVDSFKSNLTTLVGDLTAKGITPVILSQVPSRVNNGTEPAPKTSINGKMATAAIDVAKSTGALYADVYTTLFTLFTTKGGTWLQDNINANKTGLVHYSASGAVIIAQQIAALLPTEITSYLVNGTTDSFACTNCAASKSES